MRKDDSRDIEAPHIALRRMHMPVPSEWLWARSPLSAVPTMIEGIGFRY